VCALRVQSTLCNQRSGTVHSLLTDAFEQVGIDVAVIEIEE
jgi:hypothetical protein